MKKHFRVVYILSALSLFFVACGSGGGLRDIPTIAPLPTATSVSTATAAPTGTSISHVITWKTREVTNTSDGRRYYAVDDPAVIAAARKVYEELRVYYTFPNGAPTLEQFEQDMAKFTADPDRIKGAVQNFKVNNLDRSGYWKFPPLSAYKWDNKAEFNAAGTQVSMVLRAEVFFTQWVSLKTNTVTHNKTGRGLATDVTMFYNETNGLWKVIFEKSTVASEEPLVTVTPVK